MMSLLESTVEFFSGRPRQWIDARDLQRVGGRFAFRTRVSEARKSPYHLNIENRVLRRKFPNGRRYTISEYRYLPRTAK